MAMELVGGGELEVLNDFLAWCKQHKINLSPKIQVTNSATSHRFGIIAAEDIRCSETLVEIPRSIAFTPGQSSIASRLRNFKERNVERLQQTSGWISLLLALMHEIKKGDSYWAPYLALCPSINEFNQPMFWDEEERQEELAGLSVLWDVQRDLFNIDREYQQFAVPFIEENGDVLNKEIHNLNLYKHMVGFVMSYSFTDHENNETLMVPVADIFNHHTINNAQLSFDDESLLRMISTKPIKKGEEIFNTFGKLGNSHLLHMYGFVEKHQNPNDAVEVTLTQIIDTIESIDVAKLPVLQAMLAFMRKMGIADEKDPFVFSVSGLKSGPDLYAVLRILHMDFKEFCGLLQDHVSWYQDSYFLYLLEHVNQAASKDQNGEEETIAVKNDDSDDDVVIVKEIRNTDNDKGRNEKLEMKKTDDIGASATRERGPFSSKNVPMKESCSKDEVKMEQSNTSSVPAISKSDIAEDKGRCDENIGKQKKESPISDGSKKSKTRKRKPANPVEDSDDSDAEVNIRKKQNKTDKTNNIFNSEKINKSQEKNEKEEGLISNAKVGTKEETAKWVLQLPNIEDEVHSEDPDDESDDEDSETQLQLTYEQINSILPPSWKVTMQNVIANVLSQLKEETSKVDTSKMSQHALLAWQVRSGQRRILQLLKKALAS